MATAVALPCCYPVFSNVKPLRIRHAEAKAVGMAPVGMPFSIDNLLSLLAGCAGSLLSVQAGDDLPPHSPSKSGGLAQHAANHRELSEMPVAVGPEQCDEITLGLERRHGLARQILA